MKNKKVKSENDFVRLLFSLFPFLFLVLPYARNRRILRGVIGRSGDCGPSACRSRRADRNPPSAQGGVAGRLLLDKTRGVLLRPLAEQD